VGWAVWTRGRSAYAGDAGARPGGLELACPIVQPPALAAGGRVRV